MANITGSVLTLGETMGLIASVQTGSFAHVGQANIGIGGAESNVAVGLARLNIPVVWVGKVGPDSLGKRVIREIRGEGVDVRGRLDAHASTGLMLKEFTRPGLSRITYYRSGSAGSRISASDIDPDLVENSSLVHLTGITPLLSETARQTCLEVVRRARAAGVRVSVDINYRASIAEETVASRVIGELVRQADLVFGSAEEFALVASDLGLAYHAGSDEADEPASQVRLRDSLREASGGVEYVVKQGDDGASTFRRGEVFSVPGHDVEVVDTVGAGDAFVAGYLSGDVQGWTVEQKLKRANACGALMCTNSGDWEASATLSDLAEFLDAEADPVRR